MASLFDIMYIVKYFTYERRTLMYQVDLNADLGESFGVYRIGNDADILQQVSSANIACGWHAGDPQIMEQTIRSAQVCGTAIGAHPGYPDRVGFGRRALAVTPDEAKAYLLYQVGALDAFARSVKTTLQHVKLHGAFYNAAAKDPAIAEAVCKAMLSFNRSLILVAPSGSILWQSAIDAGLRCASEVFADRAYNDDGSLVSRSLPGAVIHNEAAAIKRTIQMVKTGTVETITGKVISIRAQTICIHGDSPQALLFARSIRNSLQQSGVSLSPMKEFL